MKTIAEIRRSRLALLRAEHGSYIALNSLLGFDKRDSTLSQYANASRNTTTQKPRAMGADLARRLEQVCGKPVGWMDSDPDSAGWPFPLVDSARWQRLRPEDQVFVQKLVNAAMSEREAELAATPIGTGPGSGHAPAPGYLHDPAKRLATP